MNKLAQFFLTYRESIRDSFVDFFSIRFKCFPWFYLCLWGFSISPGSYYGWQPFTWQLADNIRHQPREGLSIESSWIFLCIKWSSLYQLIFLVTVEVRTYIMNDLIIKLKSAHIRYQDQAFSIYNIYAKIPIFYCFLNMNYKLQSSKSIQNI